MKECVNLLRRLFIHARKSGKFFHGCRLDIINSLKMTHQFFPSCRPDARDVVENGVDLALAPQQAVVFDCKAVRLVLHACDQFEALAVPVDRDFHVSEIQTPRAVLVVLYHTADRNRKIHFFKHLKRNVDLAASAVHHDQVRQPLETAVLLDAAQKPAA